VVPEAAFIDDLGADSLDAADLVLELEDEFDLEFADDVTERVRTFGEAVLLVKSKLDQQ